MTGLIDMGASICTLKASVVVKENFEVGKTKCMIEGFGGIVEALGRPFTEVKDIVYTRIGDELIFRDIELCDLETEKMKVMEEIKCKPNSVNFVNVCVNNVEMVMPVVNLENEPKIIQKSKKVGESILCIEPVSEIKPRLNEIEWHEVTFDESLTKDQRDDILKILNNFRHRVSKNLSEIGLTHEIEMDIQLEKDQCVNVKPYKLNAKDRSELDALITEYKRLGIVTESESSFASPAFIVRKADGSPRMVVDYRRLNKITKSVSYPIPNFDDMLEQLNGAKFFIVLDLASGYLQIPLSGNAKEKTAFITETQTGKFERAMFGLANAPRYFAKLMDKVLGVARRKGIAFNFFDDICVYADTWKNLLEHLVFILQLLSDAGLTLQLSKCKFGMRSVEYVGYVLGEGEIRPGDRKIAALQNYPTPKNKHDIRRFIGFASFLRRFIPNFSKIVRPLTSLTKNETEFVWGESQERAFNDLKQKFLCDPVLKLYNPKAFLTELHTDESSIGLGAMLMQKDKENDALKLVYAISRCTTEAESKYHSSKLELLAIAWALDRLRAFLIGIKFVAIIDCQSLVYMNAWKTGKAQIARWMSEIAEYELEIKHRSGVQMKHVDALSRAPVNEIRLRSLKNN
ncbi:hypothetical protein TKK_0004492 [Trichogramma kaykai]